MSSWDLPLRHQSSKMNKKNSLLKQKCKTIQFMEKPETWPRPANRNCMPEIFLLSGKRDLWKNFSRLLATFRPNYH